MLLEISEKNGTKIRLGLAKGKKKSSLRIALISIFSRNSRKIQCVFQAGQCFSLFSAL